MLPLALIIAGRSGRVARDGVRRFQQGAEGTMSDETTTAEATREDLVALIERQAERIVELKDELDEARDELRETVETLNAKHRL